MVESGTKRKLDEGGRREIEDWKVEKTSKGEMNENGRESIQWLLEVELERESFNFLIEVLSKEEVVGEGERALLTGWLNRDPKVRWAREDGRE